MRKIFFIILVTILLVFEQSGAYAQEHPEIDSVTVLTDSSLAVAMSQLSSLYAHQQMVSISNVFGTSEDQTKKIENGESADLFITRDAKAIEQLKIKGMVDVYSISTLAKNTENTFTAAVVASENMTAARLFLDYLKSDEAKKVFERNGFTVP